MSKRRNSTDDRSSGTMTGSKRSTRPPGAAQRPRGRAKAEPQADGSTDPVPRRRGRPSIYSEAIADEICRRLSEGEALIAICRDEHMPAESTVRGWVTDDHVGFAAKYARARDLGLERMAEETVEIADDSGLDVVIGPDGALRPDGEVISRAKLRVDTRKWLLSKLAPKRYGERLQVEATMEIASMDDETLEARLRDLAARLGFVAVAAIAGPVVAAAAPIEREDDP